ncbi:Hypothetical protein (Fragment) [Durusdinium trenchii]|uniref:EF-hand domain-containing protein n=1 Tax=Durusdinium trenchii TaxID=1381693 RepID=A0ABP0H5Z1_9DINO
MCPPLPRPPWTQTTVVWSLKLKPDREVPNLDMTAGVENQDAASAAAKSGPAFPSASLGNQAELDEFVNTLMGSNRQVTYSQFMAEMIAAKKADNDEVLWRMFKELDSDNNNSLDANEIRAMLQKPKVREIMADRFLA